MNNNITVYGIPNCDTIKHARTWLQGEQVEFVFHDYKKSGVPLDHLNRWLTELGWDTLLNRKGTTWRKLDDAARAAVVDADSARRLMLQQPSVIKRPVIEWADGAITVGYDTDEFGRHL